MMSATAPFSSSVHSLLVFGGLARRLAGQNRRAESKPAAGSIAQSWRPVDAEGQWSSLCTGIVSRMPRRTADSGSRAASPRNSALAGMTLASVSWFIVLFGGFGGEAAACPAGSPAWVAAVAVACAVMATVGIAAAIWAYRETAGEPCGEWLLGAASLYVATLAWAATVTGAAALLFVDVCSL